MPGSRWFLILTTLAVFAWGDHRDNDVVITGREADGGGIFGSAFRSGWTVGARNRDIMQPAPSAQALM